MIIKNPYTIIAKHYRLINILILLPMIYLALTFKDISGFFKDYVRDGYRTVETNFADSYVSTLTFGALIFMTIYNGFMYIIFVSKKKNGLLYGIGAITYIALILLALLFHGTMMGIPNIDATFANFVRDMAKLSVFPQYALILVTFIKAIGFNIKTLRFEKKVALDVSEDDEELEIKVGSDSGAAKRNAVHAIRELKYYVLENKFVFSVLGVIAGIGLLIGLFITIKNNHVYSYNQAVSSDTFTIALKDSYITNVDYHGNVIAKDTYYLVIKIGLTSKLEDTTIDRSVFRIVIGDTTIFPTYDRSPRFVDVGKPYIGQVVKMGEEDDYVFAYELTEKQVKATYKLKILDTLKLEDGDLKTTYKIINVRPKNVTKTINLGEGKIGKELKLKDTTLGNTTFKINSFEVKDIFYYDREVCDDYGCKTYQDNVVPSIGKALIIIEDEIKYDEKSAYYRYSERDFYGDFVSLRITPAKYYEQDRPAFISPMKNVTPKAITDKKIYEVAVDALTARDMDFVFKVRNYRFTMNLDS